MSELTSTENASMSVIDRLAQEARIYSEGLATNIFQLGRVFTEAKQLVPRGEWGAWLRENSGASERTAQQFMQVYVRFGGKPVFASIDRSKLFKMLSLPSGTEEEFVGTNDVQGMSSREVEEAVKRVRAEAQAEIDRERAARREAEKRAEEAENRPATVPDELLNQLEEKDAAIAQAEEAARTSMEEASRLIQENSALQRGIQDRDDMLREQQEDYDRMQAELLTLQSEQVRGQAREAPDELDAEAFSSAVRKFIASCARMPYMASTFSAMPQNVKAQYSELLATVEGWVKGARKALEGGMTLEI